VTQRRPRPVSARRQPSRPDAFALGARALARVLASLPPFRGIPAAGLGRIAGEMRPRRFATGAVIFRQGDPAREFCVLTEGRLALVVDGADPEAPPVGILEAPTWFGEVGILTRQRRTAGVTALAPCTIWTLPRRRFEEVFAGHPQLARNLIAALAGRIQEKDRDFLGQSSLAAERGRLLRENARLYTEVREQAVQLELASRHKSQFLARMSHELRTPLNAIIGFSEILAKADVPVTPAEQQEFLENILGAGRHLLRLINDILDLSKIEAGKVELSLLSLRLADTVSEVLGTVQPLAAQGGVRLAAEVPEELPLVRADPRRLAQILYNLLSNAIKFTRAGGSVTVSAQAIADGRSQMSDLEAPSVQPEISSPKSEISCVEVAVSDTGIGIPAEDQARIFEEFEQTAATRSKPGGTGLGLALVKRLVAMHGGRLSLTSEPGAGSTFSFTLPIGHPDLLPDA
jgi:signal transduction histidine kinase